MATITPAALHDLLARQPELPLIDVRTPAEFSQVHVPGARNLPLGELRASHVAPDRPVYLLCHSGARARNAAAQLAAEGVTEPVVVEGGTQAWLDAGLPVARGTGRVISLERQVRIAAGSLVLLGVGLGFLAHPAFFALPGLVGAGLVFSGITDFCGMALLLAKLPWNTRTA